MSNNCLHIAVHSLLSEIVEVEISQSHEDYNLFSARGVKAKKGCYVILDS